MYINTGKFIKVGGHIFSYTPPIVTFLSPSTIIGTGRTISLSARTNGSAPITYQWYKLVLPLIGQTSSVLTLSGLTTDDAGLYRCILANNGNSVTSNYITLNVLESIGIISQLSALSADVGSTATLFVSASGYSPISYQWYKNGVTVAATGSAYNIFPVATTDIAHYSCVLSNLVSVVTSNFTSLSVY
jgi:hypothetical protein